MDATKTHVEKDLAHNSPLMSCRFDPSAKFIFAGAQDYSVWRFEVESGKKTQIPVEAWVRGMAIEKTGQTLKQAGLELGLVDEPTFDRLVRPADMV